MTDKIVNEIPAIWVELIFLYKRKCRLDGNSVSFGRNLDIAAKRRKKHKNKI